MHKTIKTYKELTQWIKLFQKGALDILIIEGSAGAGKSSAMRKALEDVEDYEYCWLEGRLSAVYLYEKAYQYRDCPIILDDIDSLYSDKNAVQVLKQLCQTDKEKVVMWSTKTGTLDEDTPRSFTTKSQVCLITNRWRTLNPHVEAVEDRGIVLEFYPSSREVHQKAVQLKLADDEINRYMADNLSRIQKPSLRYYYNTYRLKQAGLDNWKEVLIESFGMRDVEEVVLKLLEDTTVKPSERPKRFAELTGKSSRMYWRIKRQLTAA